MIYPNLLAPTLYLLLCPSIFREARALDFAPLRPIQRSELPSCFDWSSIAPSENLTFHKCYDLSSHDVVQQRTPQHYECARLLLPLDWEDSSNVHGEKVAIAIIRASSGLNSCHPQYAGHLIINPGGPGGSGVEFIRTRYTMLQDRINGGKKTFDLISFDPRGVSFSTPSARCFENGTEEEMWNAKLEEIGSLDARKNRQKKWDLQREYFQECEKSQSKIWNFMGTQSVATDMLAIVDKLDQWSKDAESKLEKCAPKKQVALPSAGKLQYAGFSYGTFLGDTFAKMFPDRVHRMLLDGNVDGVSWVGDGYRNWLTSTEPAYDTFFRDCFTYPSCSLAQNGSLTPSEMKAHVQTLFDAYDLVPLNVSFDRSYQQINGAYLKYIIGRALEEPWTFWPNLADFLNDIFDGKVPDMSPLANDAPSCQSKSPKTKQPYSWFSDVLAAVTCSDSEKRNDGNYTAFEEYYHLAKKESATFGELMAPQEILCRLWPESMQPKVRFQNGFSYENSSNTPIFFVNNQVDPVTPVTNMQKMAKIMKPGRKNSYMLTVDAVGHCALTQPVSPSPCLDCEVHQYLADGVIPSMNSNWCPGPPSPFGKEFANLSNAYDRSRWKGLPKQDCPT